MLLISPSILSANLSQLDREIQAIEQAKADWIHIDVMDGHFVQQISFGSPIIKSIRPYTKLPFDIHLMVDSINESLINSFIEAGADILTVHVEVPNVYQILNFIKKKNIKTGIAYNPETPVTELTKFKNIIDLVLIMTVNPGRSGQLFMPECLKKIKESKRILPPSIMISVDGGINPITGKQSVESGADILVSGNFCFHNKNYAHNIQKLKNCINL